MSQGAFSLVCHSPEHTQSIGVTLGRRILQKFVSDFGSTALGADLSLTIALAGDLGAGKTTLTQGIAAGIGITGPVTSPTFTLVNEYEVALSDSGQPLTIFHIDAYRLADNPEIDAATFGMEDLFETPRSVLIIEWAERIEAILPSDRLEIQLGYVVADNDASLFQPESRSLLMRATGPISDSLLHIVMEHIVMEQFY